MEPLVNRVAASSLLTLKLDALVAPVESYELDLAQFLWKGLALREADFRAAMKNYDWQATAGKRLCVTCSADAIIPQWAYMLIGVHASGKATSIFVGNTKEADIASFSQAAEQLDVSIYTDKPVVIKGCTDGRTVGPQAYATLAYRLKGVARSVMYGEPCSTVPIWKKPRKVS